MKAFALALVAVSANAWQYGGYNPYYQPQQAQIDPWTNQQKPEAEVTHESNPYNPWN